MTRDGLGCKNKYEVSFVGPAEEPVCETGASFVNFSLAGSFVVSFDFMW